MILILKYQLILPRSGSEYEYRALKILTAESYYADHPIYEREILKHLRTADINHPGYLGICHLVDDFEHQGPNGTHVCLVFELMGETLRTSRLWYRNKLLPNVLMRKFTFQLLAGLDYAHDSGIIHTGTSLFLCCCLSSLKFPRYKARQHFRQIQR
jgi:serine/threonine-protein kinase SRPK3